MDLALRVDASTDRDTDLLLNDAVGRRRHRWTNHQNQYNRAVSLQLSPLPDNVENITTTVQKIRLLADPGILQVWCRVCVSAE